MTSHTQKICSRKKTYSPTSYLSASLLQRKFHLLVSDFSKVNLQNIIFGLLYFGSTLSSRSLIKPVFSLNLEITFFSSFKSLRLHGLDFIPSSDCSEARWDHNLAKYIHVPKIKQLLQTSELPHWCC